MRFVQVSVPTGKLEMVRDVLDEEGVTYTVTREASPDDAVEAVVAFPLPTNAVEAVLAALRTAGIDESTEAVVFNAETVISEDYEELSREFVEEDHEARIAREELTAKVRDLFPSLEMYATLTALSSIIAAAGLLLDSSAIVVGSMVIAPLIGPALAASVGTVVDDADLFARAVKLQALGLIVAIGAAGVFAFIVKTTYLVPPGLDITDIAEINQRLEPDILSLVVALGAGVAGVLSLSTGVSTALVGVMIAVALVPPAATVGLGIAWGLPMVSAKASILALVNGLSINLAALVVLWYLNYRPEPWFKLPSARSHTTKRVLALAFGIVILSLVLGGVTYSSFQGATFEEEARGETIEILDQHESLTLLEFEVAFDEGFPLRHPTRVVVTVGHPTGTDAPSVATAIAEQISAETEQSIIVEVRFVEIGVSQPQPMSDASSDVVGVSSRRFTLREPH